MFAIPRSVARQIAKVFRIALDLTPAQVTRQPVSVCTDGLGAALFSHSSQFGISYRLSDAMSAAANFHVPLGLLKSVGGHYSTPVSIERTTDQVVARWLDGPIPQQSQWQEPAAANVDEAWAAPTTWVEQNGQLMQALADATATTDSQTLRYALGCLQLRGEQGEIVATDGRQVLLQSGFVFGWEDTILVPGSRLFGYGELPRYSSIRIGRTESHVVLEFGPWRYWLAIEREGRFPRVDDVIPHPENATTRVSLERNDLRFLQDNLPRLPVSDSTHALITVDLNGSVALRTLSEDKSQVSELVLSNSARTGGEVRLVSDRRYLQRAAKLGLRDLCVYSPNAPVLCQDEQRKYVWALSTPEDAIKPTAGAIRVASPLRPRYSTNGR